MARGSNKPFLPFEIVINILKRLPVKSILRFRCVCKEWKNLFKTPSFIAEHLNHSHRDNPYLLLYELCFEDRQSCLRLIDHNMETSEFLTFPSADFFRHSWRIMGSCNGLLCVQSHDYLSLPHSSLWLWNPAIGEARKVPNRLDDYGRACSVGFGFSSVINDYKIVRLFKQKLPKEEESLVHQSHTMLDRVEVYSLSTGSWKELEFGAFQDIVSSPLFGGLYKAVSADGTIFWLDSSRVISFDIAREVFTSKPLPIEDGIYLLGLGVYENKLACNYGFRERNGSRFISVWVMEEVASESVKSLSCTQKYKTGKVSHMSSTLCIWRNEIVCRKGYVSEEEGGHRFFYLLNLITKEERKINCFLTCERCDAFNYKKSLVSVWNTQHVE